MIAARRLFAMMMMKTISARRYQGVAAPDRLGKYLSPKPLRLNGAGPTPKRPRKPPCERRTNISRAARPDRFIGGGLLGDRKRGWGRGGSGPLVPYNEAGPAKGDECDEQRGEVEFYGRVHFKTTWLAKIIINHAGSAPDRKRRVWICLKSHGLARLGYKLGYELNLICIFPVWCGRTGIFAHAVPLKSKF
jgi:hypothetical protein